MALRPDSLSSFLFLCFHLMVASNVVLSAPILQVINCSTSGNYTATDAYAANVNQFFAALPENTVCKNGGFFNGTVGLGPDTVYGLAMCPADYSLADCSDCLTAAAASNADGLRNSCPRSRTVLAMFDRCLVRYSDANFFGTPEIERKTITIATTVGAVFLVISLATLICNVRNSRAQRNKKDDVRRFCYPELTKATSNFARDEELGAGGFGTVYKGKIKGMDVSVKMIKMPDKLAEQEQVRKDFHNEIRFMSPLHHCNIISLIGCCEDNKNLLLVYELMENGNLESQLYSKAGAMDSDLHGVTVPGNILRLDWPKRKSILIGVASGLVYLHYECKERLMHGDIKPSNVMLGKSFNAKLCDFGLVAQVSDRETSRSTDKIRGTNGYVNPAYADTGRACEQSDVYSFGMVMLEVVCCQRPAVTKNNGGKILNSLVEKVRACHQRNAILDAADGRLRGQNSDEQLKRVLMIGLLCVQPDPDQRPHTRRVLEYLTSQAVPLPSLSTTDFTFPTMNESRSYASTTHSRGVSEDEFSTFSSLPPQHSRKDEDAGTAAFLTSQG